MLAFEVPCAHLSTAHRPRTVRTESGRTLTYQSEQYKAWKAIVRSAATKALREQLWSDSAFRGGISISMRIDMPDARPRDLDNAAKGIMDACNALVWADDSQVDDMHVTRGIVSRNGRVIVEIRATERLQPATKRGKKRQEERR